MVEGRSSSIDIPPYHRMLWPTLQAIQALGDSATKQEIEDRAIEIAGYTEVQQGILHGDGPQSEIQYRMAWARSYLKLIGALSNSSRGIWEVTDLGRTLTEADRASIPAKVRAMSSRKAGSRKKKRQTAIEIENSDVPESVDSPLLASTVFEEWRDALINVMLALSPTNFEKLCQRVLRESGFTRVEVTGRSGDGGIDGIGVLRIALLSFHVYFQCKRYKGTVGAASIRDFRGAMVGRTDKGLFITTGSFTPDAKREATRDGAPVLDLIDGEALCILLKDLGLGIQTRQVEEVRIDPSWFAAL